MNQRLWDSIEIIKIADGVAERFDCLDFCNSVAEKQMTVYSAR